MTSSDEFVPNERLRRARSLKGWSQADLAGQIGTSFEIVSRWERGVTVPSPYYRERLCAALGQTAEDLGLARDTQKPSPPPNSPLVFLVSSHDDVDHAIIPHLQVMLQDRGITLWSHRQFSRQGAENPQKALREGIRTAQVLLVIVSPLARTSRHVREALEAAKMYGRPVYGVWIQGEQWQTCLPGDSGEMRAMIDARERHDHSLLQEIVGTLEQAWPAQSEHIPQHQEKSSRADHTLRTGDDQEAAPVMTLQLAGPDHLSAKPPTPSVLQRNRQRLLRRVQSFWITGVLDHSLHGAALIALGLQEQPDAVAHPWHLVLQQPETVPHLLPAGMRITEVYDRADGELLILGAPGSGKTTLLLELARDLLARAEHDEHHPLPVVFNLSSWAMKRQDLVGWLVEELNTKYQVPRKFGRALVEADQILPLLDGLDEVAAKERLACIEAINTYRQEHGLLSLVVCSRSTDYLVQATRVLLGCAVEVQPLTDQQVDDYLARAGEQLKALCDALQRDASLREITSTPLMLSILTLTYQGLTVEDLSRVSSPTDRQRHVFEQYVERMLRRRGDTTHYTLPQTSSWLTFLARQMKQHNQTVFYMERMQPDWLPGSWSHRPWYSVLIRLGIGIVSALILFLTVGIAIGLFIATGLGPGRGLISGLLGGGVSGLAGGLVMAVTNRVETEIQPAEIVVWSWRKLVQVRSFKKKLLVGISSGMVLGLLMSLAYTAGSSGASVRLLFLVILAITLVVVAIVVLATGLTNGVSSLLQNERDLALPNQGMRRSVRNSIRIGIFGGVVGGSISMGAFSLILTLAHAKFTAGLVNELCFLLLCGALGGTISGLIVGLPNGGIACIHHMTLRVLLWRAHLIPWNYSHFLDYAAEHILLRKIGGGYMFIHRLLLDYFASREAVSLPDTAEHMHPGKP